MVGSFAGGVFVGVSIVEWISVCVVSLNCICFFDSWGIRVQNLLIMDIKHRFNCGKLSYHGNAVNCKDIMSLVIGNTECHL